MEKYSRIEKEWINTLDSSDPALIITTLHEIRNAGSVGILPVLFSHIHQKTDPTVRNEILKLISEIKSKEAIPLIALSLDKMDFGDYLPALVAACWQSGLDFSKHLRVFANLFIQADYRTAIEAFTVIEESIVNATDTDRSDCIRYLRDAECMVTDEKMPLYKELRKVVENG